MNPQPLRLQLSWEDTSLGDRREPFLELPIAIGRVFESMPTTINGDRVSRIALASSRVSRFHAVIALENGSIVVTDTGSRNGTFVNGIRQHRSVLANGDTLQIGSYSITINFAPNQTLPSSNSQIFFNPQTNQPDPAWPPVPISPAAVQGGSGGTAFPPPIFLQSSVVSARSLSATSLPVIEIDYATIGGGLGSFIWVDLLRICGVKTSQIMALGMEDKPYSRYQRLCLNSQIPPHERLRSNSDSCPDNIWGWPSYAVREAWGEMLKGHLGASLNLLWQVFAEPTFAETYTPRSGNVFDAIDREADRIGWKEMFCYGRVRGIRKTEDGRYAIAYSRSSANQRDRAFLIAKYVHLATGYPAIQFLPDLQAYREQTRDFKSVVNAYESHDFVYEQLEHNGGTVLIRGRGIVASRVVQRLYEARSRNQNIQVLHLMRSPKPQGNKFGHAQRLVENHNEFQPFNWPKACWGGELRVMLENTTTQDRPQILADLGGTTTADRSDWRRIIREGLSQGWYQITFGEVERVERDAQKRTVTHIREKGLNGKLELAADFIIDATGLDAKVNTSPLLADIVSQYNLTLNHLGRLSVAKDFELEEMRSPLIASNQGRTSNATKSLGRMYAVGAIVLGGPYAPVDSFLGLQYAALRSVESLAAAGAPGIHRLSALRSLAEWLKWVTNQSPG
ncbi:MAG TPA: FHA domain-containing protein [Kamptonema sp.]|nr:FHA domain-containing protein [Kamptonema sp.]